MALVPYDPGGAGVRPPGPGAGPAGVLVAAGPAPGAAAAAVAAGICPRHGGAYDKECSTCIWYKKKDQWLPELQYTHPRNPGVSISSIEAKIGPDGMVRAGCPACALQNKQCAFALFAIIEPSMFQLCAFRKHHRCDKHIRCVAAFFRMDYKEFKQLALGPNHLEDTVPRGIMFAWCVHQCHAGNTNREFHKFLEYHQEPSNTTVHVLKDSSKQTVRHMQHCIGYAHRSISEHKVLKTCVRLACGQDDRDQTLLLRWRALTVFPKIKITDAFGSLYRDPGFVSESIEDATINIWKDICTVYKGKRATNSLHGEEDYVCPEMWRNTRVAMFCVVSDGDRSELSALRNLKQRGIWPNVRYGFRDGEHTSDSCDKFVYCQPRGSAGIEHRAERTDRYVRACNWHSCYYSSDSYSSSLLSLTLTPPRPSLSLFLLLLLLLFLLLDFLCRSQLAILMLLLAQLPHSRTLTRVLTPALALALAFLTARTNSEKEFHVLLWPLFLPLLLPLSVPLFLSVLLLLLLLSLLLLLLLLLLLFAPTTSHS